jgi:hypothetical protein
MNALNLRLVLTDPQSDDFDCYAQAVGFACTGLYLTYDICCWMRADTGAATGWLLGYDIGRWLWFGL